MNAPKVIDVHAAGWMIEYMIGWKAVGVAGDEEVSVAYSPEVQAHLRAALGNDLPARGVRLRHEQAAPLAAYLRSVADMIAPQPTEASPLQDVCSGSIDTMMWSADLLEHAGYSAICARLRRQADECHAALLKAGAQ